MRLRVRNARDRFENLFAYLGFVGAHGEAELCLIRDDVVLCAGRDVPNGHHSELARLHLARHDRLQRQDGARSDHDRVHGGVRSGAVASFAVDRDAQRIGVGIVYSGCHADLPGGQFIPDMQGEHLVRSREAREYPVADHRLRAADGFLGRLSDQHQCALPGRAASYHDARRGNERTHVQIVPAHVPDRDVPSGRVLGVYLAREG